MQRPFIFPCQKKRFRKETLFLEKRGIPAEQGPGDRRTGQALPFFSADHKEDTTCLVPFSET